MKDGSIVVVTAKLMMEIWDVRDKVKIGSLAMRGVHKAAVLKIQIHA